MLTGQSGARSLMFSFRRNTRYMKHGDRAEARHRGAEMLELVRSGRALDAIDHWDGPIVTCDAPDYSAKRSPFVERCRRNRYTHAQGGAARCLKMTSIAWGAPR